MENIVCETVEELLNHITLEIDAELISNDEGGQPHLIFLEWCMNFLADLDETENLLEANHNEKGLAVHGYSYSDYDGKLDLFITSYSRLNELNTILKKDAEATLKRLENFAEKFVGSKQNTLDTDDSAYDLVDVMRFEKINVIRLFLFTNSKCTIEKSEDTEINGIPTQIQIWDIQRFFRMQSTDGVKDDTDVITKEYGYPHLSCSATFQDDKDIKTYLCVLPGNFLADIYMNFTTRLIERNVRSFLSFKSKINQGILKTIQNEPDKFIAYNNGLTATATGIEINEEKNKISKIYGLQIVNGGQTTNTIFRAKYANKESVDQVSVALKLCVLDPKKIDEIGPNISRFANTQNAIRRTDFSSNNPIYIELEKISRKTFAQKKGEHVPTKWFFERTRGQYTDNLSMHRTDGQKKKWQTLYPPKQKIDKGQLSKCWGLWYQEVEKVCHGPETYHPVFLEDLATNVEKFDKKNPERSFQNFVAMKIIFDATRSIVQKKKYGTIGMGFVTDYTMAMIAHLSEMSLDLSAVWKDQEVPETYEENVNHVAPIVGETLASLCLDHNLQARSVARGNHSGVKGKTFFQILIEKNIVLPKKMGTPRSNAGVRGPFNPTMTAEQKEAIKRVKDIPANNFFELASWARETNNLQGFQRSMAFNAGRALTNGEISARLAEPAVKIYDLAVSRGFRPSEQNQ